MPFGLIGSEARKLKQRAVQQALLAQQAPVVAPVETAVPPAQTRRGMIGSMSPLAQDVGRRGMNRMPTVSREATKLSKQGMTLPAPVAGPVNDGGFMRMFGYKPDETGQEFGEWMFSDRQTVENAKAQKALSQTLDGLNLSPRDLARAKMDPEGFFRSLNEIETANMKPQTDSFYDPISRQWMRKPLGPMAVAQGTDLVDPETQKMLYSNNEEPKPPNMPEGMWRGEDGKGPPQPIPGYEGMRARIAAAGRAPSSDGADKPPSGYVFTGNPEQPLAPIKGGPADPKRSGIDVDPKIIALETQLSSKWMPIQTNFQEIKSEYGRIKTMGSRGDAVGDLALTVSLTKMLDPGSVARESEVEMTQSAAGAYQQALAWGPRLMDGKTLLPPGVRKQMVEAAGEMFGVYEGAYNGLAQDAQSRAMQYGLSPERIMLGYEAPAPAGKTANTPAMQMGVRAYAKQSGLPAEAITEFLANPATSQEITEFNEAFGEGAAQAILKAMRSGR